MNEDYRCMLSVGFGAGISAFATHYESGIITLTVNDYEHEVNYCPECGIESERN